MYSYKGIDKEYKYKRGTVEANNEVQAINKIKEEENIIIIVSLKKVANIKIVNKMRANMGSQIVNIENGFNAYTRKLNEKRTQTKEKRRSRKAGDGGETTKQTELTQKSPILKVLKKVSAKVPKRSKKIVIDEDMYNNLQHMFKEQGKTTSRTTDGDVTVALTQDMSSNKVNEAKEVRKRESAQEKNINWSLLDMDESDDPEIILNRKIRVEEKEIIMFTRRLHIMLTSGVSLLSSLSLLQKTSSKNLTKVLTGVVNDIQLGSSFSEAISKYPRQFNYAYVSLVAIGETSGSLDKSLSDIIKMKDQEQKVMRKVKVASIYPVIVGFVLVTMMIAASVFFLPRFEEMYEEQELSIPAFTELVFGIAHKIPMIVGVIAFLAILITILRRKIPEVNYIYRRYVDKLALKVPILKGIMNSLYMYSFSSTISLMLDNGIRLNDTLALTGRTINNIYIKNEIDDVEKLMTHGLSFSEALGQQPHFDSILVNIALTGEESGQMIFSLAQVADYFEVDLNRQVDATMEVIPPLSIALIALIAAPIIIAAYLPILEISSGAGLGI